MKHIYNADCDCPRCTKERGRRTAQSATDALKHPARIRRAVRERKPKYGSQEWAETRGDDLGDSPDY